MKKVLLCIAFSFVLAGVARAQTNYCDTTPPTVGTGTVGTVEVVNACIASNDTGGNAVTPTAWTLYDNSTTGVPITMTKGTTGMNGLILYTGSYTPTTSGNHSLQITATGNGKESAKSTAFLLSVNNPPSAPQAPVKLSTQ